MLLSAVHGRCADATAISASDCLRLLFLFFFNDPATTEIYTLSLHDALPISAAAVLLQGMRHDLDRADLAGAEQLLPRSEEHTSELQSRENLVCRLLLEKKKKNTQLYSKDSIISFKNIH